jgi:hypothetical protein
MGIAEDGHRSLLDLPEDRKTQESTAREVNSGK